MFKIVIITVNPCFLIDCNPGAEMLNVPFPTFPTLCKLLSSIQKCGAAEISIQLFHFFKIIKPFREIDEMNYLRHSPTFSFQKIWQICNFLNMMYVNNSLPSSSRHSNYLLGSSNLLQEIIGGEFW